MAPIVDDAASLVVVIEITPVESTVACRLLAASAALRSFNDLTVPPVPSPKVIEVAVPSPVAPIVSVKPPSAVVPPLRAVVAAVRPSFVSVPAVPPMTRSWAVPVLRVSWVPPSVDAVVAPVMVSMAPSKSPTVAVVRSSVAPEAETTLPPELANAMVLPLMVRLSPVVIADVSALSWVVVAAAPPIAVPVTVLLVKAEGVPRKSLAFAPATAAAVIVDFVE